MGRRYLIGCLSLEQGTHPTSGTVDRVSLWHRPMVGASTAKARYSTERLATERVVALDSLDPHGMGLGERLVSGAVVEDALVLALYTYLGDR